MNIKLWTNRSIPGIEFANNSYYEDVFKPHFHDHYVILTLKQGINIGECQRQYYAVTDSDILIINPSEVHTGSSWQAKYLDYVAMYVSADFFQSQWQHFSSVPGNTIWFQKLILANTALAAMLRTIVSKSKNKYSATLEDDLLLFFTKIFEEAATGMISPGDKIYCRSAVKKGVEFIKQNYTEPVSITAYCLQKNISCYTFIRSFKKFTGLTPGQFLINFRIEKAKELLRQQLTVVDACWDTGFFDQSHFNRHFKCITGITPGQYRKSFAW